MALKRLILGGAMTLAAAAAAVILPAQGAGPGGAGGVEISAPASGGASGQATSCGQGAITCAPWAMSRALSVMMRA